VPKTDGLIRYFLCRFIFTENAGVFRTLMQSNLKHPVPAHQIHRAKHHQPPGIPAAQQYLCRPAAWQPYRNDALFSIEKRIMTTGVRLVIQEVIQADFSEMSCHRK